MFFAEKNVIWFWIVGVVEKIMLTTIFTTVFTTYAHKDHQMWVRVNEIRVKKGKNEGIYSLSESIFATAATVPLIFAPFTPTSTANSVLTISANACPSFWRALCCALVCLIKFNIVAFIVTLPKNIHRLWKANWMIPFRVTMLIVFLLWVTRILIASKQVWELCSPAGQRAQGNQHSES